MCFIILPSAQADKDLRAPRYSGLIGLMAPRSTFAGLPRELRYLIYKEYFTRNVGHMFNYNRRTLRKTSGNGD
jgi:hypothetical protein